MESRRALRDRAAAGERAARHGAVVPRGLDVDPGRDPPSGRFGLMFPDRPPCDVSEDAINALAKLMERRTGDLLANSGIPAGFTYLGQFIDHDITFDPTSVHDQLADPLALENFRTPRLDLDSLYGSGPVVQPFLYDWWSSPGGVKLLVGHSPPDSTTDLPRNEQGRALIGDARNDEHLIIAQLHLLFIQFHNAVVDHLSADGVKGDALLTEAQRLVRWHYQWIVVNEFLPKVVGSNTAGEVFTPGTTNAPPAVHREHFRWQREPFIPFEFSGAAYRFGHSMVRDRYGIKRTPTATPALLLFPDSDAEGEVHANLGGLTWLTQDRVIYWPRFFDLSDAERPPQPSFKIDTAISKPLFTLPDDHLHPPLPSLPLRNLLRGRKLRLPSGQEIADAMHAPQLSIEQLRLDEIDKRFRSELERSTPLWYYILCEAESKLGSEGKHLGPVGGRIVAEVLVGLLEGDPNSFLRREPTWRPRLGTDGNFRMADLVRFVQR
jgi:hypothetical protein